MENIISVIKQIFTCSENSNTIIGLSEFKTQTEPVKRFKKVSNKKYAPQELKLSELMRKAY